CGGRQIVEAGIDERAIVIAAHRGQREVCQQIVCLARPQRARYAVAQIHDGVGTALFDVGQYGLKSKEVAVDVGNYRKAREGIIGRHGYFRSSSRSGTAGESLARQQPKLDADQWLVV